MIILSIKKVLPNSNFNHFSPPPAPVTDLDKRSLSAASDAAQQSELSSPEDCVTLSGRTSFISYFKTEKTNVYANVLCLAKVSLGCLLFILHWPES